MRPTPPSTPAGGSWHEIEARPPRHRSTWWSRLVGPLVAAGVAAVLAARGRVVAAGLLVVLVLAVTVASAISPTFERAVARLLARIGHVVGRLLSILLLGLFGVVVLVPIWVIARVGGWDTLRSGRAAPGAWARREVRWWQRTPSRPFLRDEPRTRRQRLHALAVVVVPLALVLALAVPLRHRVLEQRASRGEASPAPGSESSGAAPPAQVEERTWVVEGQGPQQHGDPLITDRSPWAEDVLRGRFQIGEYDPINIMRIRDEDTTYFHYHDRVRASWRPPTDDALDVWYFGSSQLLGVSVVRDDHTIPSELARLAWERDRIPVRSSNFAIDGYETLQETVLMEQMLAERPAPDLVVFYGGYNDIHDYVRPGGPQEFSHTWAEEFVRALREAGATIALPTEDSVPRNPSWSPSNAARLYDRAIGIAASYLASKQIPFLHYLQASLWTRDRPEDEATLAGIGADQRYAETYGAVYDAARAAITSDVIDLSDALDDLPGVVYWDEVHHNEAGNAAVARAAYPTLRAQLLALSADGADPEG